MEKILVISLQSIGNNVMLTPMLRTLRENRPDSRITLLVYKNITQKLFSRCPYVDEIVHLMDGEKMPVSVLTLINKLRRQMFDISLTVFPANDLRFNLIARIIGARERISHTYPGLKWQALSFLQNKRIPIYRDRHDVEQNMALLSLMGISAEGEDLSLELWPDEEDRKFAESFLKKRGLEGRFLVGLQPGSDKISGMDLKRWGEKKYAELSDKIIKEMGAEILIFGDKKEKPIKEKIVRQMENKGIAVPTVSLNRTVGLIERCSLFISNDSGMMHVAVAMQIPTLGIFGPTDPVRTAPWGTAHRVVKSELVCVPCWKLVDVGQRSRCIHSRRICMEDLSVEKVFAALPSVEHV